MKLFVLTHNVAYEGGQCLGVYSTASLVEAAKLKAMEPDKTVHTRQDGTTFTSEYTRYLDELDIEEFTLDEDPL